MVSKQNQNVKREMQPKNMGELQPTGRSELLTQADIVAFGNTDPPEQQAYTTTFGPREVFGPPMKAVARPTLTPRDQTLNYTERTSSLVLEGIMLKSSLILFALARTPVNEGLRTSGLLLRFTCWLFTGDLCGCAAVPAVGCVVCTAGLM